LSQAAVEVEALTPTYPALAETIESMESRGIDMIYGRWLIEGAPRVLLIDTKTGYRFLDEWKGDLWNTAGIPIPPGDEETNEAVVFGYLVAWFLGEVCKSDRIQDVHIADGPSSLRTRKGERLSLISMNGSRV
jgi:glycogen synthase